MTLQSSHRCEFHVTDECDFLQLFIQHTKPLSNEALSQFEQVTTEVEKISDNDMTDAFSDFSITG